MTSDRLDEHTEAAARAGVAYPLLALLLPVATLAATYLLLRYAPSPVQTTVLVVGALILALTVTGYLGARRGHAAPFVAAALILPYLLAAVAAYAATQRAANELGDLFGDEASSAGPLTDGGSTNDQDGDAIDDDLYAGVNCEEADPQFGPDYNECIANGGDDSPAPPTGGNVEGEGGDCVDTTEYDQVDFGMTEAEVNDVLGSEGQPAGGAAGGFTLKYPKCDGGGVFVTYDGLKTPPVVAEKVSR
jgi:hypothetical protein